MYVVSCRRGFDSDQLVGAENRYRNYTNPLDPSAFAELTLTELLAKARTSTSAFWYMALRPPWPA